jgi:hypothetical protein
MVLLLFAEELPVRLAENAAADPAINERQRHDFIMGGIIFKAIVNIGFKKNPDKIIVIK